MRDRIESGRAYSFYREQVSGLSIAKVYTRYRSMEVTNTANSLAVEERSTSVRRPIAAFCSARRRRLS